MNGGECYLYDPNFCDGDFCPGNCDNCYKAELIWEAEENNEA